MQNTNYSLVEDVKLSDTEMRQLLEEREQIIQQSLCPIEDTLCGIGSCHRKKCLQKLAKPGTFLVVSSVISLVQGLFFTYSNATLSTIEKQFGLPSKLSGLTTTGNDIVILVLSLPLSYFAGRSHRPRWLAFAMFLSAIGCAIAITPHFWHPPNASLSPSFTRNDTIVNTSWAEKNDIFIDYCKPLNDNNKENCTNSTQELEGNSTSYGIVAVFSVAQMFAGVASLLYYTIGYSYLDEAVSKQKVPLFLSISGGMRLLGPVCGYSLAAWSLNQWVDPSNPNLNISPSHPHWIGAWWIGYVVIGTLLMSLSWLLVLFPKTLPGTRMRKYKELCSVTKPQELNNLIKSYRPNKDKNYREMLPSLLRIFSNKILRLILLNQVLFWFAFYGFITFKSKYLEHQFKISAAEANKYIASVSLVAALIGWVGTGATLSYLRPKTKLMIGYMALLSFISCLCHLIQLTIFCDQPPIYGLKEEINNHVEESSDNTLLSECLLRCECQSEEFSPICLTNSTKTFFNPCYANCHTQTSTNFQEFSWSSLFSNGFCYSSCSSFTFYLSLSVVAKMAQAASRVPVNLILLRCVDERDKDLCLGVFNAVLALAASIPAPIIFGWALDSTCILWKTSCLESLQCWLYDNDTFRKIIHGLPSVFLALCCVTDLLLLKYHNKLVLYPEKKKSQEMSNTL